MEDDLLADATGDARQPLSRSISESQFTCPCCFELMLEPTTLNCGHSFCRYCLATWTETSSKKTCPECRQNWVGLPNVNFTLRNTISQLYPEKYQDRLQNKPPDFAAKLKKFDSFNSSVGVEGGLPGFAFICGIVCALVLVLIPYIYSWLGSPDTALLVHKPVTRWTRDDVFHWMADLGPWAKSYADKLLEIDIDGYLLLSLTEEDLESHFNMTDLHRRAFLLSVQHVKDIGVKPPSTFWEYKELYPRNFYFFMSSVQALPRTLMFYTYVYHYDDTFLPFIHEVCPTGDSDSYRLPSPTKKQWISFLPPVLYLPFFVIAKFAWLWFSMHYVTVAMVTVICITETFQEANSLVLLYRSVTRGQASIAVPSAMKSYARSIFGQTVLYLILPFTPWIICDVYFYFCVYILPLQTMWSWVEKLYQKIRAAP